MKKILCYGDSNTYGFNPATGERYNQNIRWPGVLKNLLSDKYEIIEEGCNNRCGFVDNPGGFIYSAQRHFPTVLKNDIDILILALGTNDLQFQYSITFETIEQNLENLIKSAESIVSQIIIVPPVILHEEILHGYFSTMFDLSSIDKSYKIGHIYADVAQKHKCHFIDFNEFVKPSNFDGLHYSEHSHKIIAQKLYEYINS